MSKSCFLFANRATNLVLVSTWISGCTGCGGGGARGRLESFTVSPEGNFKRSSAEEEEGEEGEEGKVRGEGAIGLNVLTLLGCT